jgi:hypothetical protein
VIASAQCPARNNYLNQELKNGAAYKAVVRDTGERDLEMDAMFFEGSVWLVPVWVEHPGTANRHPERLVRLNKDSYQVRHGPTPNDIVVKHPVPISEILALEKSGTVGGFETYLWADLWHLTHRTDKNIH